MFIILGRSARAYDRLRFVDFRLRFAIVLLLFGFAALRVTLLDSFLPQRDRPFSQRSPAV
jgi:hypothetical protein